MTNDRLRPLVEGSPDRGMVASDTSVLALVPHYRCEVWLEHCLASLVGQSRPLDGIVVIDDASPEPPEEIVRRFPGVTLLRAAANVGPYRLVQQVIEETAYDRYLFQDADDWSAPDRLERLLDAAGRTGADLVGSDYLMLCTDEVSTLLHSFPLDVNAALAQSPTCHALQHPTSLVSRSLVMRLGGYASGMRFSGDDEFLRRAAHVAPVANVPRVLYFRRHREESLTTSPATGHGSPARRAVLQSLAQRARANAESVARGEEPELRPHATAPPVVLDHVRGPRLQRRGAGGGRRPAPTFSGAARDRHAGPGEGDGEALEPVLVTGAPASGADALLWALAQHPSVVPVVDLSWLEPLAESLRRASAPSEVAHAALSGCRPPQPLDTAGARPGDLRSAVVAAVHRMLLGGPVDHGEPADEPQPCLEDALWHVAAFASGTPTCWMAAVPSDPDRIGPVLEAFPRARVIHVVRPVDAAAPALIRRSKTNPEPLSLAEAFESWAAGVRGGLAVERAVGAKRLLRVGFDELVTRPRDVVGRCLGFAGLSPHPACASPLEALDVGSGREPATTPRAAGADDLSTALCGPPQQPVPAAGPALATTPAADRPRPPAPAPSPGPAPAPSPKPTTTPSGDAVLPPHVARPATLLATVPPDAVVAVVTKGEGRFLHLSGARVWHFPQTRDGEWAGYHPGGTDDIVDHLEDLAGRGAGYFFIPYWAQWWLDHYEGLRRRLEASTRLVAEDPEAGVLFRLGHGDRAAPDAGRTVPGVPAHGRSAIASPTAPASPAPRRSVTVISWDVAHNPLGRAHVLAELLRQRYDVELVGPEFEYFGGGVWEPMRDIEVPLRTFPGGLFPQHFARSEAFARTITSDALVVSKPRLPSYLLGMLAKESENRPLVLDVDDWELSFVGASEPLTVDQVRERAHDTSVLNPYGRPWTQVCETLIDSADRVTVSNEQLRGLFGGTLVPHARDERLFDPERFDRARVRRRFGFEDGERIVMFAGTPRRHKGVIELATALREIGDPRARLCLIGTSELEGLRRDLAPYADLIRTVPYQPFGELPALLAAADMVAVLQDPHSAVSRYQMPAKVTDALAMCRPCLVRPVPPLEPLIAGGHVEAVGSEGLTATLAEMLADEGAFARRALANRELFLSTLSFGAVRPRLEAVVEELLDGPPPLAEAHRRVLDLARDRFDGNRPDELGGPPEELRPAPPVPAAPPEGLRPSPAAPAAPVVGRRGAPSDCFDIVMFWKQHDTGIYGRRHDMLMHHLAHSERVGRVVQFDAPVDVAELRRRPAEDVPTHGALVRRRTLRRLLGTEPVPGLHQHSFVYAGGNGSAGLLPRRDEYLRHVEKVLSDHGVGARPTVFWVYPKSFEFPSIARALEPELVVADVVDDHRTWARPATAHYDRIVENYEEIVGLSDIVLTNCEPMRATMSAMSSDVHLVPNAAEHPDPCLAEPLEVPEELRLLNGPVIGYAGNLSSRIDVDLLEHVAAVRPHWNLVLIGSAHAGQAIARLQHLDNVTLLGPRPYEDAKRYIRAFDVAIIPHVDNEMTSAMNPLKAFVYCALNVPVVSTDIPNLGELRPLLSVAAGRDDFVASIDAALTDRRGPLDCGEAARIMRRNSWAARTDTIVALLGDALHERRAFA